MEIIGPDEIPNIEERLVLEHGQFGVTSLALAGTTLVSSSFYDLTDNNHNLRLWNLSAEPEPSVTNLDFHNADVAAVDIDSRGAEILTGSVDFDVLLIDANTHQRIFKLSGHQNYVLGVSISADGTRGLSGSADRTVIYWDLERGERLRTLFGHSEAIFAVDLTPDGTSAVSAGCGQYVKNVETGSLDCVKGEIITWDLANGEIEHRIQAHEGTIFSIKYTNDGSQFISGAADGRMILWDAKTGEIIREFHPNSQNAQNAHDSSVRSVSLSPDNRLVVSGSRDGSIRIWEVVTGTLLRTFHFDVRNRVVYSTAFGATYIVAGLANGSVRVFGLPSE